MIYFLFYLQDQEVFVADCNDGPQPPRVLSKYDHAANSLDMGTMDHTNGTSAPPEGTTSYVPSPRAQKDSKAKGPNEKRETMNNSESTVERKKKPSPSPSDMANIKNKKGTISPTESSGAKDSGSDKRRKKGSNKSASTSTMELNNDMSKSKFEEIDELLPKNSIASIYRFTVTDTALSCYIEVTNIFDSIYI